MRARTRLPSVPRKTALVAAAGRSSASVFPASMRPYCTNAGSGTAALQGTTSVAAVAGVATFSNLSYNKAETIQVDFSATALTGARTSFVLSVTYAT